MVCVCKFLSLQLDDVALAPLWSSSFFFPFLCGQALAPIHARGFPLASACVKNESTSVFICQPPFCAPRVLGLSVSSKKLGFDCVRSLVVCCESWLIRFV